MNNITIDIETIPSQEIWVREYVREKITHPGNITKEESIKKWYEEKFDDAVEKEYLKCSFDGAMCNIIAIGLAVNDDEPKCFYAQTPSDEINIIKSFFNLCEGLKWPTIVGHNVTSFDLKVIRHRAIILGLNLPNFIPWDAKPWDKNPYDTMVQWDSKNNISMDKLAKSMGFDGKDGVDGSMVYGMWKNGMHEEIKEYCMSDVDITRKIFKRMNNLS